MAENLNLDINAADEIKYQQLLPQLKAILDNDIPILSNLSNITAVLMEFFPKISWVGFYITKKDKLLLGPFQGKIACTTINIGNGVCGTAALRRETIIVDDVESFPGHIACDAGSKSEIVVPIFDNNENLFGVLDLDSYKHSSFNETDKKYLEELGLLLKTKLELNKFILS